MNRQISFTSVLQQKSNPTQSSLAKLMEEYQSFPEKDYNLRFNNHHYQNKPQLPFDDWIHSLPSKESQPNHKYKIAPQLAKYADNNKKRALSSKPYTNTKLQKTNIAKLCQLYQQPNADEKQFTWKCNNKQNINPPHMVDPKHTQGGWVTKIKKKVSQEIEILANQLIYQQKKEQGEEILIETETKREQAKNQINLYLKLKNQSKSNQLVAYSFASDFASNHEQQIQSAKCELTQNNKKGIIEVESVEYVKAYSKQICKQQQVTKKDKIKIDQQPKDIKQCPSPKNVQIIESKMVESQQNQVKDSQSNSQLQEKTSNNQPSINQHKNNKESSKIVKLQSHVRVIYDGLSQFKKYRQNNVQNKENQVIGNKLSEYTKITQSIKHNQLLKQKSTKEHEPHLKTVLISSIARKNKIEQKLTNSKQSIND